MPHDIPGICRIVSFFVTAEMILAVGLHWLGFLPDDATSVDLLVLLVIGATSAITAQVALRRGRRSRDT